MSEVECDGSGRTDQDVPCCGGDEVEGQTQSTQTVTLTVDLAPAPGPDPAGGGDVNQPSHIQVSVSSETNGVNSGKTMFVAPALRVETLKDEDGHSSTYGSDEEALSGHGDGSDLDSSTQSQGDKQSVALKEFVPPDDELRDKIIKQVEFYFSDANILKDAFLLKHVRRNKQGYVSLKLITSFRKVKSLTKDYRVVAFSLRQSDQLEVNEEGTKVRRTKPLPDYDETTPSRTIVAVNLPVENPSIENVAELFSKCGDIALVRILKPGKSVPQDIKKHMSKHPEIGTTVCVVIEFEKHEAASAACASMTNSDDWRKGMRVVLLSVPKKEKSKEVKPSNEKSPNEKDRKSDEGAEGSPETKEPKDKKSKKSNKKKRASRVEMLVQDSPYSSSSDAENYDNKERQRSGSYSNQFSRSSLSPKSDVHHLSPNTTPRTTPRNSPRSSPRSSPSARRKSHGKSPLASDLLDTSPRPSPSGSPESRRRSDVGSDGASPNHSPWVQRRLKAQAEGLASVSPLASPRMGRRTPDGKLADMGGVMRQPKGPDGSKGFHGRGKPIPSDTN